MWVPTRLTLSENALVLEQTSPPMKDLVLLERTRLVILLSSGMVSSFLFMSALNASMN